MQPGFESSSSPLTKRPINEPCSSRKRRSTKAQHQLNALPSSFPTHELYPQLIITQTERMQEVLQRHVRSLLLLIDEKEAMLQSLTNTNLQLHNKVAQFILQSEAWKNVAQNNETMASRLRSKLEEVIAQSRAAEEASCTNESDAESSSSPHHYYDHYHGPAACQTRHANAAILYSADSNQNDNNKQQQRHQVVCRVCGKREVSALLLPCRHLCLCKICELEAHFCPICKSLKKASLQVYLS